MPCQNHPQVEDGLVRCATCAGMFCGECIVGIGGIALCGPCKTEWLFDRLSGIPDTRLDLASIWRRFLALLIDSLVVLLPYMAFFFLGFQVSTGPKSLLFWPQLLPFLLIPLAVVYHGWMLAVRGQTLGKMALQLRVVNAEGGPLQPGQAWGRAVLQQVFASCLSVFNYLPAFLTQERTCIHDMAAKTRVVNWRP